MRHELIGESASGSHPTFCQKIDLIYKDTFVIVFNGQRQFFCDNFSSAYFFDMCDE